MKLTMHVISIMDKLLYEYVGFEIDFRGSMS